MTHTRFSSVLTVTILGAIAGFIGPSGIESGFSQEKGRPSALETLGNNRQPIKVDSDRLDVFDKEGRAIFVGNVVAVQGDTTVKCTTLEVFYEQKTNGEGKTAAAAPASPASALPSNSAIRRIECTGPVTIVSKTQIATGDHATFDRESNRVLLTGNVILNDGPNVTKGPRLVYDLKTGIAKVEGGRVRTMIVPDDNNKNGQ